MFRMENMFMIPDCQLYILTRITASCFQWNIESIGDAILKETLWALVYFFFLVNTRPPFCTSVTFCPIISKRLPVEPFVFSPSSWNCANFSLNLLTFPLASISAASTSLWGFHNGWFRWSVTILISSLGACDLLRMTEPSLNSTSVSNWWKMAGLALPILILVLILLFERWTSLAIATLFEDARTQTICWTANLCSVLGLNPNMLV